MLTPASHIQLLPIISANYPCLLENYRNKPREEDSARRCAAEGERRRRKATEEEEIIRSCEIATH